MHRCLEKLWAVMRRDLLSAARYKGSFWTSAIGLCAETAAIYFLARAVGPGFRPNGISYFAFVLVGTSFHTFLWLGMSSFIESIRSAQQTGAFEVLMTTSTPGPLVVLLMALSSVAGRVFSLVLAFFLGIAVFGARLQSPNLPGFLLLFLLSCFLVTAFGMTAAAVQVLTNRGTGVVWLFGTLLWLLTGTMFPVSVLPGPLLLLARIIPFTHALSAMRGCLLAGQSFAQIFPALCLLTVWTAIALPASILLFSRALRRATLTGTLSCY